jgi:hypothetical protein
LILFPHIANPIWAKIYSTRCGFVAIRSNLIA